MSAKAPPPGFVDLATAQNAGRYSVVAVIGVVVDFLPPKTTYMGDLQLTLKLQDYSLRYSSEHLKVKFFKRRFEDLPPIKSIGDVVLLRSIKVGEYAGENLLVSTPQTGHLVFSGAVVPSPAFKLDYVSGNGKLPCQGTDGLRNALGPVEQDYIITLKSELNVQVKAVDMTAPAHNGPGVPLAKPTQPGVANRHAVSGAYSRKFRLVKDLKDYIFSDVCVEVVKKFTTLNGACELYVTDYTANKQMFYYAPPEEKNDLVRDGDNFGYSGPPKRTWPGPYGFLVFKVNLSEPHASFANHEVSEGEMIALENVKVKLMPNNNRLEGDMWPDQNNASKVQIKKLRRDRVEIQNLLLRKSEYWDARRAMLEKATKSGNDAINKKKKKKSQQKKRRALQLQQEAEEAQQKADQEDANAVSKIQANKHIRCNYKDQPLTTISNILDATNTRHTNTLPDGTTYTLPFVNARYHIKARVVDFYPPRLQEFAIQLLDNEADDDKSEYSVDMTWQDPTPHWEWSFALQVEEVTSKPTTSEGTQVAAPRMWLNVSHTEAQHLFGNAVEDPRNLRDDKDLLNQLREKLYILWGDLEERKREEDEVERKAKRAKLGEASESEWHPSNLPFSCCLQEYGALREGGNAEEIADWERQFMMSGVTIL